MKTSAPEGSPLRKYALMLRRGAPIVVLTIVLLTGAAILLSVRQEPLYQASSNVFVDTKAIGSTLSETEGNVDPERVLETQASVARVPTVISLTKSKFPTPISSDQFLSRSAVTADPKADILNFSVTASSPRVAEGLAKAYARGYMHFQRRLAGRTLRRAQLEVQERLQALGGAGRTTTGDQTPGNQAAGTLYTALTERNELLQTRKVLLESIVLPGPPQDAVRVQPHPVRNALLGGMFGLLLGVGLVIVREALNTRVRSAVDVEEELGLPLLGRLSAPPRGLRDSGELTMLATPDAPSTEAFKLLATNIDFLNLDRGIRSFMITSANPGEGKSTTIANLGVTFARLGRQVILVDLDLRRPTIHRFFDLPKKPGVTDITLGRVRLDEVLSEVPILGPSTHGAEIATDGDRLPGSLEVLTAGSMPPNPSEFVRSQALGDVLARLEKRADLVLVDAPAMLAVSDAVNLTPQVDALIALTKVPAVRRPALAEMRRILDNAPVEKLGFILTGAEAEDEAFMGTRGYHYGYGDRSDMEPEEARQSVSLS